MQGVCGPGAVQEQLITGVDSLETSVPLPLPLNVTVTVTYPDTYPSNPTSHCADRNCRISIDATAPFVPLPSQYLLGGAYQITLHGGSQLVIQR